MVSINSRNDPLAVVLIHKNALRFTKRHAELHQFHHAIVVGELKLENGPILGDITRDKIDGRVQNFR